MRNLIDVEGLKVDGNLVEYLKTLTESAIGMDGKEYPSPVKLSVNVGDKPLSLRDQIRRILRTELSKQMQEQGAESFEEANDLDIEDDSEPISPYEFVDMEPEIPIENTVSKVEETAGSEGVTEESPEEPQPEN